MSIRFARRLSLWLVVTLAAVAVPAARAQEPELAYQKFVLPNGLTVIVHEDHKAPIVAINMWYHVGSKNEAPGKAGFAHLFEHLMFGGSQHAPGSFIKALQAVGATDMNGTTNFDRTNYFEDVPTSALDYALWMEADRMAYLDLSQKTLDLQRGVVENEKREDENEPYQLTEEHFPENTFPAGHPYSWDTIGSMTDLDAASFKDVEQWFKTYYGPSNVVIVLAGDIDVKTAKEKVEKYFGDIPPGPPVPHEKAWIAKMTGTHREITEERVPLPRIYKVWNIPPFATADSDYLTLVAACLGEGKTSRLYKRLVYDDQIASDVTVFNDAREIAGQFIVQITAARGHNLGEIEKAMDQEIERFLKTGPTPAELERVKTSYLSGFLRGIERIGGFGGSSDRLAHYAVFTGDPGAYKTTLARVRNATAGELKSAAERWLSDGVYIAEVVPFPDYKASAPQVDHSQAPVLGPAPEANLPQLERKTLPNGLKVILAERKGAGLVNLWLAVDAGFASDEFGSPGTAKLASALLTDGTATRNALQISDQTALLGAQLESYGDLDFTYVKLSALKAKLDPSLDLFSDVVLHPTFPAAEFQREQKLQIDAIQQEQGEPIAMALRVFPRFLYGAHHAYGNPLTGSGTPASVEKITREDLVKFHNVWFRPNNATLVIVGDTTLADMVPKLEKVLGAWKHGEVPRKDVPSVPLPEKSVVYLVDKPNASQSVIFAGNVSAPPQAASEIVVRAMNDAIGGNFSARLNMDLREDKHWAYGAGSILWSAREQRPFIAFAPVQTDKTKDAVAEVNKDLREFLTDRPVTAGELRHIQANETLRLPGSRETLNAVGTSILALVKYHWPDDYYDKQAARIRTLTPGELDAAAREVIHPDHMVWVVVGDRAKIETGIRELQLGEIHLIDADGNPK